MTLFVQNVLEVRNYEGTGLFLEICFLLNRPDEHVSFFVLVSEFEVCSDGHCEKRKNDSWVDAQKSHEKSSKISDYIDVTIAYCENGNHTVPQGNGWIDEVFETSINEIDVIKRRLDDRQNNHVVNQGAEQSHHNSYFLRVSHETFDHKQLCHSEPDESDYSVCHVGVPNGVHQESLQELKVEVGGLKEIEVLVEISSEHSDLMITIVGHFVDPLFPEKEIIGVYQRNYYHYHVVVGF